MCLYCGVASLNVKRNMFTFVMASACSSCGIRVKYSLLEFVNSTDLSSKWWSGVSDDFSVYGLSFISS